MDDDDFELRLGNALEHLNVGQKKWHTDRGVPIAIVLMIAVQTFGGGVYMTSMASGINANTDHNAKQSKEIKLIRDKQDIVYIEKALLKQSIKINHDEIVEVKDEIVEVKKEVGKLGESSSRIERKLDQLDSTLKRLEK